MKSYDEIPQLPPPRFIEVEDCTLAYYVDGPVNGPALVLCHGLAAGGLQFARDLAHFADKGYRVIVPDLRGHGQSGVPRSDDLKSAYSVTQLANDLLAILDTEGVKQTAWVGNSLGGILALELMGREPERLSRVATFGTSFALSLPGYIKPGLVIGFKLLGKQTLARITAQATSRSEMARAIVYYTLLSARMSAVAEIADNVRSYDFRANAKKFRKPFLLIRGDRDKAVNKTLEKPLGAMRRRKNFTLVDLKDAGHCANIDQPARFHEIVMGFLSG